MIIMGLDMYLIGLHAPADAENPADHYNSSEYFNFRLASMSDKPITINGKRVVDTTNGKYADLGYWRKHPDLHGFIIKTFSNFTDGADNGELIPLDAHQIHQILDAVENASLPTTTGFFFRQAWRRGLRGAEGAGPGHLHQGAGVAVQRGQAGLPQDHLLHALLLGHDRRAKGEATLQATAEAK